MAAHTKYTWTYSEHEMEELCREARKQAERDRDSARGDLVIMRAELMELAQGTYKGNSISYIYDKMMCYKDQIGIAFEAFREMGFDGSVCRDNDELRLALKAFAKAQAEDT